MEDTDDKPSEPPKERTPEEAEARRQNMARILLEARRRKAAEREREKADRTGSDEDQGE
jgi:hypothetical protein